MVKKKPTIKLKLNYRIIDVRIKPTLAKGTRDFNSQEVAKRNYITQIIKDWFTKFGFNPIETPSFENSETLLGKYGEEGDRLIFKILRSGDFLKKVAKEDYEEKNLSRIASAISDKALRYDLTVPFARYVVQNQNDLVFPFKRYQMQPVWRADRPQKGRYREFNQCDADVIGSKSLWQEVEFVQLYDAVFSELGVPVHIQINNRKILSGIAEVIQAEDKLIDFTVALDKLDKIGEERVKKEMLERGISKSAIETIQPLFEGGKSAEEDLQLLRNLLKESKIGLEGVSELEYVVQQVKVLGLNQSTLEVNITLARGLDYYTGIIYEVAAPKEVGLGSIGGGGRYDDLTGIFGMKEMSGVGISFGLDRIYLALEELDLFPEAVLKGTQVLFINFGESEAVYSMKAISKLRQNGIRAEMYPDAGKMGRQMTYADRKNIPFVVLCGTKEIEQQSYTLKNMESGEQYSMTFEKLLAHLQQ